MIDHLIVVEEFDLFPRKTSTNSLLFIYLLLPKRRYYHPPPSLPLQTNVTMPKTVNLQIVAMVANSNWGRYLVILSSHLTEMMKMVFVFLVYYSLILRGGRRMTNYWLNFRWRWILFYGRVRFVLKGMFIFWKRLWTGLWSSIMRLINFMVSL